MSLFFIFCLLAVAECAQTTFHDATVSLENTDQNVWGRDSDGVGCTSDSAYALVPKGSVLTTGLLVSGFGFRNETELQPTSRILKVDVRLRASADPDRRTTPNKFHIGLESVVVRSSGLDIYSQPFGGEPRPLSSTPVQLDFSLEKILAIGTMLFRGDQVISDQFGIVTYWRNHDNTSNWYVYLDCVQARLVFENDVPRTPSPSTRPTVTIASTSSFVVSFSTATTSLVTNAASGTTMPTTNTSEGASLFTAQNIASDTALALDTETVIAIVVPVAAACVLFVTVGVICILRRRRNERKPAKSTPTTKDTTESRKATVRVSNNAFEGTIPSPESSPDKPTELSTIAPPPPPTESPRPVEPQNSAVAKSVALPTQPEKPSHIVIASYPGLRPAPSAAALASPNGAPAGMIFVERGYEVPYSFDSDSQQVYKGQHGIAADFTPAVGREAHANMALDRHVRDQYASPAKQNQVLDDIF